MTMLDNGIQARNVLPSSNHVTLKRNDGDDINYTRPSLVPSLSISTQQGSPIVPTPMATTSCSIATITNSNNADERPGYISPPESTTRRSTREEKGSPFAVKSLPSIHEALGDRSILNPTISSPNEWRTSGTTPATATTTTFPDLFAGATNPFSQHALNPSSISRNTSITEYNSTSPKEREVPPLTTEPLSAPGRMPKIQSSRSHPYPVSPRTSFSAVKPEPAAFPPPTSSQQPSSVPLLPYHSESSNHNGYPPFNTSSQAGIPPTSVSATNHREPGKQLEGNRSTVPGSGQPPTYGETIKRHLDVYDIEVAFHEMNEAASRTSEFARYWSQRQHQVNRLHVLSEAVPPIQEIDDTIRRCQTIMENLHRVRDVAVQQTTLSEERAHAVHTQPNQQYRDMMETYKSGGFAAGDAKKRRGKAAPPGRCHSCHRDETPEWRRGPDGARTLCNACGLHYAKLTRKLSANRTAHIAASSLRPKELDGRP